MALVDELQHAATYNKIDYADLLAQIAGDENAGQLLGLIIATDQFAPSAKDIKALKLSAAKLKAAHETLEDAGVIAFAKAYVFEPDTLYKRIKAVAQFAGYREDNRLMLVLYDLPRVG